MNCTNEELLSMIISVANGCGITSESNELMLLRDEALARMNTAQQSVHPTVLCTCPAKHYEGELVCQECGLPISHSG